MSKKENPSLVNSQNDLSTLKKLKLFIKGARPATLYAAVAPVVCGTSFGVFLNKTSLKDIYFGRFLLALLVSFFIQIGTNYANDYFDGIRGTDDKRKGPLRLVGSNLVSPKSVKILAYFSFLTAAILGLILCFLVSYWLIILGALSILAGYAYTGGPKPYGYYGLGELFVFIFFGLIAAFGSAYVQDNHFSFDEILIGIPLGFLTASILIANNYRDITGDKAANKNTLATMLGPKKTRYFFAFVISAAYLVTGFIAYKINRSAILLSLLTAPIYLMGFIYLYKSETRYLIRALKLCSLGVLFYSVLFSAGLFL
jgi:1,4-dihydroxy-2-naphthoate octaprenyltransferase